MINFESEHPNICNLLLKKYRLDLIIYLSLKIERQKKCLKLLQH